jgi:flagellar M-ring protein FliF
MTPRPELVALPDPAQTFEAEGLGIADGPQMMSIEGPRLGGMNFGDMDALAADDPVSRLQNMIADREIETLQILENWMVDPEEREDA